MTIQQIKYVLAVAKHGHFGLAASKCYVTQSTLSTMIGKFEKEIEIKIFDRKNKPVTITKEGLLLIDQLKVIIKEVDNFQESVGLLKGEIAGELKIGIIPTVAPYLLPRFLSDFATKYPKLQFSVTELTTESIVQKIKARELDIGIAALPLEDESLIEHPLYNEGFVLYDCYSEHKQSPVNIKEINQDKLCLLADGHCLNNQVLKICDLNIRRLNSGINFEFKAGSIDSLIRFVRQSKGLTLLPYLAILDFDKKDKLRIRNLADSVPVRNIGIVTHRHFVKKKVLDLLKSEIQKKIKPLLPLKDYSEMVSPFYAT